MNEIMFHPEWLAIVKAIREVPEDNIRRLVAADWLEERGLTGPASFIRYQLEFACEIRMQGNWSSGHYALYLTYGRGFLTSISCDFLTWCRYGPGIYLTSTLKSIRIGGKSAMPEINTTTDTSYNFVCPRRGLWANIEEMRAYELPYSIWKYLRGPGVWNPVRPDIKSYATWPMANSAFNEACFAWARARMPFFLPPTNSVYLENFPAPLPEVTH